MPEPEKSVSGLEPEDSFARLLGRQPTDAERQDLFRVRDALGLRGNDALWLVLIALEHYQKLYQQIPQEISKASDTAVAKVLTASSAAASTATKVAAEEA